MRHTVLPLLLAALPATALAQCPVAADLAGGVRFDLASGGTWDIHDAGDGRREVTLVWDPAYPTQVLTYEQGIYLVALTITDGSTSMTVNFAPTLQHAPAPATGAQWEGITHSLTNGTTRSDRFTMEWGEPEMITFGDCTYASLPMTWTLFANDGFQEASAYSYIPEFGAVVLNGDGFGTTWTVTGVSAL